MRKGHGGDGEFETRINELIANLPDLAEFVEPLLIVMLELAVATSAVIFFTRLIRPPLGPVLPPPGPA